VNSTKGNRPSLSLRMRQVFAMAAAGAAVSFVAGMIAVIHGATSDLVLFTLLASTALLLLLLGVAAVVKSPLLPFEKS